MRVLVVTAVAAEAEAVTTGLCGMPSRRMTGTADPTTAAARTVSLPGHTLQRLHLPAGTSRAHPGDGAGLVVDVLAAGVGPAAAAAGTAAALTAAALESAPYCLVVSAGIGGGFPPVAPVGTVVVADAIVAADLGAETPGGFLSVETLGFGRSTHLPPPKLVRRVTEVLDQPQTAAGTAVDGSGRAGPPTVAAPVLTVSTATGSAERAAGHLARHPRAGAEAMEGFGVAEAAVAHRVPVLEIRAVSNQVGPRDRTAWKIGSALDSLRHAFHLLAPVLEEFR
jgi:futalosine hydrolase